MVKHSSDSSDLSKLEGLAEWPMLGLWARGENGYVWIDGEPDDASDTRDPGPWLVPKDGFGKTYAILRRRKALLREFTNLGKNASRQRVLAFADKWGGLGVGERLVAGADGQMIAGASFGTWRKSAVRLAMLTGLWQRVKASDSDALSDFVDWTPDRVIARIPHVAGRLRPDLITLYQTDPHLMVATLKGAGDSFENSVLASRFRDPDQLLKRWTFGDPVEPMRYYVCREVNRALRGQVNRFVLPYRDNSIHYVPDSLLACVYVAFQDVIAGAVAGERECLHCGRPFTATRKDRRYCSDNCAKRAWDKRQP